MIKRKDLRDARERALKLIRRAAVPIRAEECDRVEVADFGLGNLQWEGAQILTIADGERICAKLIVLLPGQTLPEHWHPPFDDDPGKEEIIRALYGQLFVAVDGPAGRVSVSVPPGKEEYYTAHDVRELEPGQHIRLAPGQKHWLQAGSTGTVCISFSTSVRDGLDRFTDPSVVRRTVVTD